MTADNIHARLYLSFGGEGYTSLAEVDAEIKALREAVRAETLREVRGVVEGMPGMVIVQEGFAANGVVLRQSSTTLDDAVMRGKLLAALDALEEK
jgi:hypothetical protein